MRELVIEINKDIDRYQESVALGLTAKRLIFSVVSVVVGGGIVLLLYKYIGLTGAAYVAIPCVAPIALGGFYSFNGMDFYEYMGKKKGRKNMKPDSNPVSEKKNQEEFEAMKKKTKNIVLGMIAVIVAAVAGLVIYKAHCMQ